MDRRRRGQRPEPKKISRPKRDCFSCRMILSFKTEVFDSSALDSLQSLGRHCVTCVAESEAGSSLHVCLHGEIHSTCFQCKDDTSPQRFFTAEATAEAPVAGNFEGSPHCCNCFVVCKHLASVTPLHRVIHCSPSISGWRQAGTVKVRESFLRSKAHLWLFCQVVTMRLAFLTLMVVYTVGNVSSMSTCKTVDLEMVKKKRIEAIRSQILSKLRLPKAPEPDQTGDEEEIPSNLLSVYNSTKELLKEQQIKVQTDILVEQEEEEYFAKVLHKFNMTKQNDTESTKNSKIISMFFNMAEIRSSVGDSRLLTSAELRMLIKQPAIVGEQRVELYYLQGTTAKYHESRFLSNNYKDKWLSFDVAKPVRLWLEKNDDEQSFQLRLFCDCTQTSIDSSFSFSISGTESTRGDTRILQQMTQQPPYILTMSIPKNTSSHLSSRRKRSTDARDTCTAQTETCCVRSLYIDFRKDLGWKWIHKPTGYHADYCMGSCTYIGNAENKYSQILALYKHHNPGASAHPCCVPQAMEPLPILYYVGRQHKVEQLSNMIVKSCKCS